MVTRGYNIRPGPRCRSGEPVHRHHDGESPPRIQPKEKLYPLGCGARPRPGPQWGACDLAPGIGPPIRNCARLTFWCSNGGQDLRFVNCEWGRGDPPWLAVRHREVDVGDRRPPPWQPVGSSGSIHNCQWSICHWQLGRGSPPTRLFHPRENSVYSRNEYGPIRGAPNSRGSGSWWMYPPGNKRCIVRWSLSESDVGCWHAQPVEEDGETTRILISK